MLPWKTEKIRAFAYLLVSVVKLVKLLATQRDDVGDDGDPA